MSLPGERGWKRRGGWNAAAAPLTRRASRSQWPAIATWLGGTEHTAAACGAASSAPNNTAPARKGAAVRSCSGCRAWLGASPVCRSQLPRSQTRAHSTLRPPSSTARAARTEGHQSIQRWPVQPARRYAPHASEHPSSNVPYVRQSGSPRGIYEMHLAEERRVSGSSERVVNTGGAGWVVPAT